MARKKTTSTRRRKSPDTPIKLRPDDKKLAQEVLSEPPPKHLGPKTVVIKCHGVRYFSIDDWGWKTDFAPDHKPVRLVHKQDQHIVTRCEPCQKLYQSRKGHNMKKIIAKLKAMVDDCVQAEQSLKEFRDMLSAEDLDHLRMVIENGKKAEKALKELQED